MAVISTHSHSQSARSTGESEKLRSGLLALLRVRSDRTRIERSLRSDLRINHFRFASCGVIGGQLGVPTHWIWVEQVVVPVG